TDSPDPNTFPETASTAPVPNGARWSTVARPPTSTARPVATAPGDARTPVRRRRRRTDPTTYPRVSDLPLGLGRLRRNPDLGLGRLQPGRTPATVQPLGVRADELPAVHRHLGRGLVPAHRTGGVPEHASGG